ncbi:MAG: hypothetical protein RLZZ612_2032 [Pseudomonadota bacterium]|jgi:prepilin-type N-terminal cleavage/methylation domain-containing protein
MTGCSPSERGMTLMELMIAMALSGLVLVALSGFTSLMFRAIQQDERLQGDRLLVDQVTQRVRLELNEVMRIETASEKRFTYTTSLNLVGTEAAYFRSDIQCDDSRGALALIYRSFPVALNTQGPVPIKVADVAGAKEWVLYDKLEQCQMEYGAMPLPGTPARGLVWQARPEAARARDLMFVRWQVGFEPQALIPVLFARVQMMK